jgi:cell division transport system permease protein
MNAARPGPPVRKADTATAARNRLLPEGRVAGPMPWVIAIMMFLTVLAAAAGLGLNQGMRALSTELAGRATIQVIDADAETRNRTVGRILARLRGTAGIKSVQPVDAARLADQLRPWLGSDMAAADLPIPALVDVEFTGGGTGSVEALGRLVAGVAPNARVEPHGAFLGPLTGLVGTLAGLAALLVLLMAVATGAVVVLAARGAHESHRGTIDILHLMGATDVQIARLFQRRIALDALLGGGAGFILAAVAILLVGQRLVATGSDLLQAIWLPPFAWLALLALPVAGVILATLAARWTVLRALGRAL